MIKIENPGFLMTANKLSTNARKPSTTYETTLHPPICNNSVSAEPKLVVRCEKQNVPLGKTLFPKLTPLLLAAYGTCYTKFKETILPNQSNI